MDRILEAARLAPSSFGLQPYTLLVAEPGLELRQRIAPVAMNPATDHRVLAPGHFRRPGARSPRLQVEEMVALIAEERGQPRDKLAGLEKTVKRQGGPASPEEEGFEWAARQAYLGLGMALAAAAMERVDAPRPWKASIRPGWTSCWGLR